MGQLHLILNSMLLLWFSTSWNNSSHAAKTKPEAWTCAIRWLLSRNDSFSKSVFAPAAFNATVAPMVGPVAAASAAVAADAATPAAVLILHCSAGRMSLAR